MWGIKLLQVKLTLLEAWFLTAAFHINDLLKLTLYDTNWTTVKLLVVRDTCLFIYLWFI